MNIDLKGLNFIKWYKGEPIITLDDFKGETGIDLHSLKPFFDLKYFIPGRDWNAIGTGKDREELELRYNIHYEEALIPFITLVGLEKVLKILEEGKGIQRREDIE